MEKTRGGGEGFKMEELSSALVHVILEWSVSDHKLDYVFIRQFY